MVVDVDMLDGLITSRDPLNACMLKSLVPDASKIALNCQSLLTVVITTVQGAFENSVWQSK